MVHTTYCEVIILLGNIYNREKRIFFKSLYIVYFENQGMQTLLYTCNFHMLLHVTTTYDGLPHAMLRFCFHEIKSKLWFISQS